VKHIIPKVFYLSKKLQFLTGKKIGFFVQKFTFMKYLNFFSLFWDLNFFGQKLDF